MNKHSIKIKKVFFTLITGISFIKGQIDDRYKNYYFNNIPNAPTTKSFLRYGDVQNSEYTGTNSPAIPLLKAESGNAQLDLTLKYISGNGIKVNDEAGSVGLGWTISLPTITQSVLGYNDLSGITSLKVDLSYNPDGTPFPILNYNQKYYLQGAGNSVPSGFIKNPERGRYSYFWSQGITLPVNGVFKDVNNNINYDTSPDIFTLNLFGEKILFIDENYSTSQYGVPHVYNFKALSGRGYKINYLNDTFTIMTPDGSSFEFGIKEETGIFSLEKDQRNYLLTKIKDKNNNTIQLAYDQFDVPLLPPTSRNLNYTYSYSQGSGGNTSNIPTNDGWGANGQYDYAAGANPPPYVGSTTVPLNEVPSIIVQSKIFNQALIKTITGDFGQIEFNYSDRLDYPTKKLDNIVLKNGNSVVKNIVFDYSYFISSNNSNDPIVNGFSGDRIQKRLKLNSVSLNNDGETYYFQYNNIALPSKISNAVDYWGFYNGGDNNKTLYPNPNDFNISINIPITDLNNNKKNADITYAKAGVLEKIIYPTKGYSTFDYELNTAGNLFFPTNWTSKLTSGAGLRLKSQSNFDKNADKTGEVNFSYEGGISMNPLALMKTATYTTYDNTSGTGSNCAGIIRYYSVVTMKGTNENTASPLSSGDIIGYSKVNKNIINILDQSPYKIETNYSNTPDKYYMFYEEQLPVSMPSIKADGVDNGNMLSQIYYNSNGVKLKEVLNQYKTNYSTVYYGTSFQRTSRYLSYCTVNGGNVSIPISLIGQFSIFAKESLLYISDTNEYHSGATPITTRINYFYNDNNLLGQKSTLMPTATQISEYYSYSSLIPRFSQANILSDNIDKKIYKNGKEIFHESTQFDDVSHFNPTSKSIYDLQSSNASPEVTFDKYDLKGNLQQYTSKDGVSTTIIWGYNQTQPIAKIVGANFSDIQQSLIDSIVIASDSDAVALPNNDESAFLQTLKAFRDSLPNYQITTYTYDPLIGVRTITPPSGIREVYFYDNARRLMEIRENNQTGKLLKEFQYNYKH